MANELYRAYNEMVEGFKTENDNMFEHGVMCWMKLNPENPFEENSEAAELFFTIQMRYNVWKMKSADYKVNRKRMLQAAKDLCALYPKRPYKFDKKADAEDQRIKAQEEEARIEEQKLAEQKEIEAEADRIVKAEAAAEVKRIQREKAKTEWEQQEAEIKAQEQARADALQKAIEDKRAQYAAQQESEPNENTPNDDHKETKIIEQTHILGVIPDPAVTEQKDETVEKREGFFKRFFSRKKAKQ